MEAFEIKSILFSNLNGKRFSKHHPQTWVIDGDLVWSTTSSGTIFCISVIHFERVKQHIWYDKEDGYIVSKRKNKIIRLSRFIKNCPKGLEVDHINGLKNDNSDENLRICTRRQNSYNVKKKSSINGIECSSTKKGVNLVKGSNKWRSRITINGKRLYLGLFNSEEEAGAAYNKVARKLHGEFFKENA